MIAPSIQENPASVKTQSRPRRVTCGGHRYWQSVIRSCGHDDLIPDELGGYEFAARDDIPCADCRRQRDRAALAVATLIGQPYPGSRGGSASGRSAKRPTEHRGRRQRRPSRQRQILDALHTFNAALDFLSEIELGQRTATDQAIAHARAVGAQALRALRQLGAAV